MESFSDLDQREQNIIQLARKLRSTDPNLLDEPTIDAEFLFRFDPIWCQAVAQIRSMMRGLLGKTGDGPLSIDDGAKILVHLEKHLDLRLGGETGPKGTRLTINSKNGYLPLDENLRAALDKDFSKYLEAAGTDTGKHLGHVNLHGAIDLSRLTNTERDIELSWEDLWHLIWGEANQTNKVINEIKRLAYAFQLIPAKVDAKYYPQAEIGTRFQRVVDWIVWEIKVPSFLWTKTLLLENRLKGQKRRTIRPHQWIGGPQNEGGRKAARLRTISRIRTWTVYYLSKRGGGQKTQIEAVDLWNLQFADTLDARNYRLELERLLRNGSQKG